MSIVTDEQLVGTKDILEKFSKYAPHWKGAITPQESIEAVLKGMGKASVENGDEGSFVSHWRKKMWLEAEWIEISI